MQQRRAAVGRPSGTDGSDFSYRMVVESRYQKVAEGKSRLGYLIIAQALSQVVGSTLLALSFLRAKEVDDYSIASASMGLISVIIGEIGRRRSKATLLRLYLTLSSISVGLSVPYIIRAGLLSKVTQHSLGGITRVELLEAGRVTLGVLLQFLASVTTASLVQNMTPPKRAA